MNLNIVSLLNQKDKNIFFVAIKMLLQSKKKLLGMIIGVTLAAFILMQQPSIYQGVTDRIAASIKSIPEIDLWVMDKHSSSFEQPTYFNAMDIFRIQSTPGVAWAVQLYKTWMHPLHEKSQKIAMWEVIAVDPVYLLGLPKQMIAGKRQAIHHAGTVIVDGYSLQQFASNGAAIQIGDKLSEGQNRWQIMGITKPLRTYSINPRLFITSNHLANRAHTPSFILVKLKPGYSLTKVSQEIEKRTGFLALTSQEFIERSNAYFRHKTPIVVGFVAVALIGFIIGLIMMWQIFNNFILSHLHQLGMLKILGLANFFIVKMVFFQALIVGIIGYFIAFILTSLFGLIFHDTIVAFHLSGKIILLGALGAFIIVVFSSFCGILKVIRMDSIELCRDLN
ncbi:MAG: ABC transporter permease [Proteobacteria bacterium]|nr:ABC transporter permease [Pseudomonadota bacterium]